MSTLTNLSFRFARWPLLPRRWARWCLTRSTPGFGFGGASLARSWLNHQIALSGAWLNSPRAVCGTRVRLQRRVRTGAEAVVQTCLPPPPFCFRRAWAKPVRAAFRVSSFPVVAPLAPTNQFRFGLLWSPARNERGGVRGLLRPAAPFTDSRWFFGSSPTSLERSSGVKSFAKSTVARCCATPIWAARLIFSGGNVTC